MDIYLDALTQILGGTSVHVALFYGHSAMQKLGAIDAIRAALPDCHVVEYGHISPNPDVSDIQAILDAGMQDIDRVIGIGGGSVLDVAKSVAFMAKQTEDLYAFLTHRNVTPAHRGLPFVAIPTTSGTGSEVTPWATVWDRAHKKKYSLSHPLMFPHCAIIDPGLTLSLPPYETAYTGFDALSHALEAFWSRYANPVSDLFAIEAIRLSLQHLGPVMDDLGSRVHRAALAQASLYAGLAFSTTKTTAAHAVSYPMTMHFGLPHGVACSLTLGEFWRYNLDYIDAAKVGRLMASIGQDDPLALPERLKNLARQIGLPLTLKDAGIPVEGIDVILNEGFHPERVVNNPRPLNREDLRGILEKIYG
jgi:phosphonate metabolism-associated iron-containing alcohol dehydrogenase